MHPSDICLVGVVGYHVGLILNYERAWRVCVTSGGRQFDPGTGQLFFLFFLSYPSSPPLHKSPGGQLIVP